VRTTLTLDEDVRANLEQEMRRTGLSFKETVNEVIRIGLTVKQRPQPLKPFKVRAKALGLRPGLSYDNIEELLDLVEGPEHK
jgi:hypothetical protein